MGMLRVAGAIVGLLAIPVLAAVPSSRTIPAAPNSISEQKQTSVVPATGRDGPGPTAVSHEVSVTGDIRETARNQAANAFGAEVKRLSSDADAVDRLWQVYKAECGVQVGRDYDFGREWFSIGDLTAKATIETSSCTETLQRISIAGKSVRRDLLQARAAAHEASLGLGTEVGLLRWHSLEWQ